MEDQPQAESQQAQEKSVEVLQAQELEKLEQSFTKVGSYKNSLQREQVLLKESRDLNIPLGEYRRLYELSQKESPTPTKLHKFWKWTGIGEKKGWDFVQLLIVPIALGIATTYVQDKIKQAEKAAAKDSANQETLNKYLDEMSKLLPDIGKVEVKAIAKARTLTVMRTLDNERNSQLLGFLREAKLIGKEPSKLSKIDFEGANLRGVDLKNVNLSGVDLSTAVLAEADLSGAKLIGAELDDADLKNAKLDGADFGNANLVNARLSPIDQIAANFCDATTPEGEKSKQGCPTGGAYVNASAGLVVRDAPAGHVIGGYAYGTRVRLTGAQQYVAGRTWSQLTSGNWVMSDYLSFN